MNQELQRRIQQLIDGLVGSGEEVGLQVAAYVDGEPTVDAWAGVADETTGRPVDGDTLFTSWSTTKGFVATCVHILADRGLLDYDAPIATYWPEFAADGKAAATVRHALTHMAGVPHLPADVTPELMTDWDAMCAALAAEAPLWEPLRIRDFYLGIPDAVEPRVAPLRQDPVHLARSAQLSELGLRVMPPHVTSAVVVNRPDFRRASVPGGGGVMNARAIARHYAMLACSGALDGARILSPEGIDIVRTPRQVTFDEVSGGPGRFGLGYVLVLQLQISW